jgi:DNA polymerase-3 subunit epsilon
MREIVLDTETTGLDPLRGDRLVEIGCFDVGFINAELDRCGKRAIARDRLVDTLMLARRKFVGVRNTLDDLCSRFGIDNSKRTKHGALLDAELLAEVYLELIEARQAQLGLAAAGAAVVVAAGEEKILRVRPVPLTPRLTDAERVAHRAFVATLGEKAIWTEYLPPVAPPEPAAVAAGQA